MIETGIFPPSSSPWSSPLHLVEKSRHWWMATMWILSSIKQQADNYPVPHIRDVSYILQVKTHFSKIDLKKERTTKYQQPKKTYQKQQCVHRLSYMNLHVCHSGLRNAGQTFQRFMHRVLEGLNYCIPLMDDVLVQLQIMRSNINIILTWYLNDLIHLIYYYVNVANVYLEWKKLTF